MTCPLGFDADLSHCPALGHNGFDLSHCPVRGNPDESSVYCPACR